MSSQFPESRTRAKEESASILPCISADGFAKALQHFPPASLAKEDYMSGLTADVNGRPVVVTFHRRLFRKHRAVWYAWCIHDAQYVESP
jgi:hypothetical protein